MRGRDRRRKGKERKRQRRLRPDRPARLLGQFVDRIGLIRSVMFDDPGAPRLAISRYRPEKSLYCVPIGCQRALENTITCICSRHPRSLLATFTTHSQLPLSMVFIGTDGVPAWQEVTMRRWVFVALLALLVVGGIATAAYYGDGW